MSDVTGAWKLLAFEQNLPFVAFTYVKVCMQLQNLQVFVCLRKIVRLAIFRVLHLCQGLHAGAKFAILGAYEKS